MRQLKILTLTITWLLLVMLSSCTGLESVSIARTMVGENLITEVDPSYQVRFARTSPDARHIAYVATKGDKPFMVVDGIEGKRYDPGRIGSPVFSPDSRHLAYIAGDGITTFVVLDSVERKVEHGNVFPDSLVFGPDSKRLAYSAKIDKKQFFVIDGVEDKPYDKIGAIVFSPDSNHLAYSAMDGNSLLVVTDGKEGNRYKQKSETFLYCPLFFSPDNNHLAYVGYENRGSPDYVEFVVLDGVEGKRYKSVKNLTFSQDSKHLAYSAANEKDGFLVVDGIEKEKLGSSISNLMFGPDSKRLAYTGFKSGMWAQQTRAWVVIDGIKGKTYLHVWDVTFSPDAQHVAYLAGDGKREFVVIDGTKGKEYDSFLYGSSYVTSRVLEKRVCFSSAHSFHYLARKGNSIYLVEEILK